MSDSVLRLTELDRGFRKSYLDYETLTAQLRDWANAFPNVVRLSSLGTLSLIHISEPTRPY